MSSKEWSADQINDLMRSYQTSCIFAAAADLDLFGTLAGEPCSAEGAAEKLGTDLRGTKVLLDALSGLKLLQKKGDLYSVPKSVAAVMTSGKPGNQLAMAQHQSNCLRRWAQLASVVKTGHIPAREPSIRGDVADYASFIEAMDNISGPVARRLIADIQPLQYRHVLDIGGASGTWTIAFLRANSAARATLFDLPEVIPQAKDRLERAGVLERVTLVPGDFNKEALPQGADLMWLSAIAHQNSREQNKDLFKRMYDALDGGGQVLVRDIIMEESRVAPIAGALFAVNMLVNTESGGTFTLNEFRDDLEFAGFEEVRVVRHDEGMLAVVGAKKKR